MKTITIKQPFATLIAEGLKEYEFRTWKAKYRGELLIHAGLGIDKKAMKRYEHLNLEYPSGVIIAKCNMTDCRKVDDTLKKELQEKKPLIYHSMIKKDSNWEGYGFKLEDIEKINPIPAKGKLSFWDFDYKEK